MPAPDLATLMQIENAVESACDTVLSSSILNVSSTKGNIVRLSPNVNVKYTNGSPLTHMHIVNNISGSISSVNFDTYNGTLEVLVNTERNQDSSYHNTYVGTVRSLFNNPNTLNNIMPYHCIVWSQENGSSFSTSGDDAVIDTTHLTYNLTIGIRPEAWPIPIT